MEKYCDVLLQVRFEISKQNIKQYELAKRLKISAPYLSEILTGKKHGDKPKRYIGMIQEILRER